MMGQEQVPDLVDGLEPPHLRMSLLDADTRQRLHKVAPRQDAGLHSQRPGVSPYCAEIVAGVSPWRLSASSKSWRFDSSAQPDEHMLML